MNQTNTLKRREKIANVLLHSEIPLSATALAKKFQVSRQVIVGDVALLRAQGASIIATPRGYLYKKSDSEFWSYKGLIACKHNEKQLYDELYTVVDFGGTVIDVIIEHPIYGQLLGSLDISSRYDVDQFVEKITAGSGKPLCELTGGIHLHNIGCKDKDTFKLIVNELTKKGIALE